jgi:DUF1365 family protein
MHHRFAPKAHRFDYGIFMFALDLDELPALHRKLRLFSHNRRNLYALHERDFLPTDETLHNPAGLVTGPAAPRSPSTLKARVVARLADQGIDLAGGRVLLVAVPRVLGYLFNPVSLYFCFDRAGRPAAALAEVTNTFKEMKPYLLGPGTGTTTAAGSSFALRVPKNFYVSPFTDVDVDFAFTLRVPGDRLSVQIDDFTAGQRTLTSVLTGSRTPLTDSRLLWYSIKYPLITLQIIGLIHWNALKLYLKRVPWFAKSARPEAQRDLYRPHISIANQPEA